MQPTEHVKFEGDPEQTNQIDRLHKYTDANGQLKDYPVGAENPLPAPNPIAVQHQTIVIVMDGKDYTVRTQTLTTTSTGYGHGEITNDLGDIKAVRP